MFPNIPTENRTIGSTKTKKDPLMIVLHVLSSWMSQCKRGNGILLPKLFWPTVRKNCSSDREKNLKFEAEGWEFSKFLRSLEQFIQTVKGQNNFW